MFLPVLRVVPLQRGWAVAMEQKGEMALATMPLPPCFSFSLGTPRFPFIPLLTWPHRAQLVPQLGRQRGRHLSLPLLTLAEMHGSRGEAVAALSPLSP